MTADDDLSSSKRAENAADAATAGGELTTSAGHAGGKVDAIGILAKPSTCRRPPDDESSA